jgi:ATP-dependent Zn protease
MNRVIQIDLPRADQLVAMFRVRLRGDLVDEDIDELGLLALGSTGADVERIVKDARRIARRATRPLTLGDLRLAITAEDDRSESQLRRTAVHEAGHAVVEVLMFGPDDLHASIVRRAGHGGFVQRLGTVPFEGTREDFQRRMQIILAGRTAELLLLDSPSAGAGSRPGSDLERATSLAAAMAGSFGLLGPHPLVYMGMHEDPGLLAHDHVFEAVASELKSAEAACMSLLRTHRAAVSAVAELLLRDGSADGRAIAAAMEQATSAVPKKAQGLRLEGTSS